MCLFLCVLSERERKRERERERERERGNQNKQRGGNIHNKTTNQKCLPFLSLHTKTLWEGQKRRKKTLCVAFHLHKWAVCCCSWSPSDIHSGSSRSGWYTLRWRRYQGSPYTHQYLHKKTAQSVTMQTEPCTSTCFFCAVLPQLRPHLWACQCGCRWWSQEPGYHTVTGTQLKKTGTDSQWRTCFHSCTRVCFRVSSDTHR